MIKRRIKVFLFALLMCMMVLPVEIDAYEAISVDSTASFTVSFQEDGQGIEGAVFKIYQVATVDENVNFTLTGDFANYNYSINSLTADAWTSLANTLNDEVVKNSFSCLQQGITDAGGKITFNGLRTGLYLVTGFCEKDSVKYTIQPFLVSLPDYQENAWHYDVVSNPKFEKQSLEETVDKTVIKIWDDTGYESKRPASIQVQLYRSNDSVNEAVGPAVELSQNNDWTYTWKDLDAGYNYTVIEVSQNDSYIASKEIVTGVDQITNTYKKPEETETPVPSSAPSPSSSAPANPSTDTELPFTGILWWPIPVIACIGLGFYCIGYKLKKDHE